MKLIHRFLALFRRAKLDREMDAELRAHLERETERNIARGMTPDEARFTARRAFGGLDQLKERERDARGGRWLTEFVGDIRFAFQALAKTPGFAFGVVATLALGIGSAAAIFSVANRVVFQDLPYPDPDRLVVVGRNSPSSRFLTSQLAIQYATYRDQARSFSEIAAFSSSTVNLVVSGGPGAVNFGSVSVGFFTMLGATPTLGRDFLPSEEEKPGANSVVVLTHRLWQQRFGGDPDVLGTDVVLDRRSYRIVGVLPADFQPPSHLNADIYRPLVITIDPARPFRRPVYSIARLRPGTTLAQAREELRAFEYPDSPSVAAYLVRLRPEVLGLEAFAKGSLRTPYWAFLGAVGFLYAIACVNAINLILARTLGREKELSIRLALGSGRIRIARLLLAESLLITAAAGATGFVLAHWLIPPLLALSQRGILYNALPGIPWRLLGFGVGLGLLTATLLAVAATWRLSRMDPGAALRGSGTSTGDGHRLNRLRDGLVVIEAALAMALLAGAGLMGRSVWRLQQVDLGFDPANKVAVWLEIPGGAYGSPEARTAFFRRLEEQLRRVPKVRAVAMTNVVPLAGGSTMIFEKPDGTEMQCAAYAVSAGYPATLGLGLKRGRWFDQSGETGPGVVAINEAFAREYFGSEDPMGKTVTIDAELGTWEIIGVAADVRVHPRMSPEPQMYYPYTQRPQGVASVLLWLNGEPDAAFEAAIRRAVFAVDPLVAAMPSVPLSASAQQRIATERSTLRVLRLLSALALILATFGLFSVMAYAVTQRRQELAIRMALGAQPPALIRFVMHQGLKLVAFGAVVGFAFSLALARWLRSVLFETSPLDPITYVAVATVMLLSGALASWLPARRAARVDPMTALRAE